MKFTSDSMKKENNRHAYGKGNGKFGKKQKRIEKTRELKDNKKTD